MQKSSLYEPLDVVTLASRDDANIRPVLLRAITDLYVQKLTHTADEQNQYTELALGLLAGVDAQTRDAITACLRDHPAAPPEVLRSLTEGSAVEIQTANLSDPGSISDDLIELFFTASSEERRLILTNLEVVVPISGAPLRAPAEAAIRLEEADLHNAADLIRALERILGVNRSLSERIVNDASGEPFVVIAKALGIKTDALQRILLAINPGLGKSVIRMLTLMQLFTEIPEQVAAYMISLWQRAHERTPPSYESVHWNDERRDARSLASPAPHSSGRDRLHYPPGRLKSGSR